MSRWKAPRVVVVLFAVAAVGVTASAAQSAARSQRQLVSLNHQIASAINEFRTAHHLTPLHISPKLNASSRQHSEEMGADGYFDHPSANGTEFWKRIQSFYSARNYPYWTVGENLLYASPTISADDALQMWIASPEHLKNLKNKRWRDLGVSAVRVTNAGGVYDGYTVTIITTDFGARH